MKYQSRDLVTLLHIVSLTTIICLCRRKIVPRQIHQIFKWKTDKFFDKMSSFLILSSSNKWSVSVNKMHFSNIFLADYIQKIYSGFYFLFLDIQMEHVSMEIFFIIFIFGDHTDILHKILDF